MPRKPAVPPDDLIKILIQAGDIVNSDGTIPGPRQAQWNNVADQVDNKLKPSAIYTFVFANRHESYNKLCEAKGITPRVRTLLVSDDDEDHDDEHIEATDQAQSSSPIIKPKKTFQVLLTNTQWDKIKPVKKSYRRGDRPGMREKLVLPAYEWQDVVIEALWDQHKIPCPYTFLHSHVYTSPESEQFLKIDAQCNECGCEAEGRILTEPRQGESATIEWVAQDTRQVPHESKRPLRGTKRKQVAGSIQYSSAALYRNSEASKKMNHGDVEPPNLWKSTVLRKAKQQYRDEELNVPKGAQPILNIENMKHTLPYVGSIHDIGLDPFFVHYYTPPQMLLYKSLSKQEEWVLCVDATGFHLRRIQRLNGRGPHIFLYQAVMHSEDRTVPVLQMLTESQTAESVSKWLTAWRKDGAPCPQEVVVDNSGALKSALAMTFAQCLGIADYKEKCFLALTQGAPVPPCYLRLDVAHYINAACKWDIWKDRALKRYKDLYIRCLGLLIQATTLDEFKTIYQDILLVSAAEYEGPFIPWQNLSTVSFALSRLTDRIKGSEQIGLPEETEDDEDDINTEEEEDDTSQSTEAFLTDIESAVDAKVQKWKTGSPNAYFVPSVTENFKRLARDLVLWSAVMVKSFNSPRQTSSSASVEGYISDLKTHLLQGCNNGLRVDRFLGLHYLRIDGACKLQTAHPSRKAADQQSTAMVEEQVDDPNDEVDDHNMSVQEELSQVENWRGLVTAAPKKSKYMTPFPELQLATQSATKPPKKCLLQNGNLTGYVNMDSKSKVYITNTCAFDTLAQMIANGYINFPSYRTVVNTSNNDLLRTGRLLATEGAVNSTYVLRCEALTKVLEPTGTQQNARSQRRSTLGLQYDCWDKSRELAEVLLATAPSATVKCDARGLKNVALIRPNSATLLEKGISTLQSAVEHSPDFISDHGQRQLQDLKGHLFIDVDLFTGPGTEGCAVNITMAINEVPVILQLQKKRFILGGIQSRNSNHLEAFVRRSTGVWQCCNDLMRTVSTVDHTKQQVSPTILFYALL